MLCQVSPGGCLHSLLVIHSVEVGGYKDSEIIIDSRSVGPDKCLKIEKDVTIPLCTMPVLISVAVLSGIKNDIVRIALKPEGNRLFGYQPVFWVIFLLTVSSVEGIGKSTFLAVVRLPALAQ